MVTVCGAVLPERAGITATRGRQPETRGCRWGNGPALCHPGRWLPAVKRKTMPGLEGTMGTARALTSGSPGLPNCVQPHHWLMNSSTNPFHTCGRSQKPACPASGRETNRDAGMWAASIRIKAGGESRSAIP